MSIETGIKNPSGAEEEVEGGQGEEECVIFAGNEGKGRRTCRAEF